MQDDVSPNAAPNIDGIYFLSILGSEIARALDDTVGHSDSQSYFRLVGLALGEHIEKLCLEKTGLRALDRPQLLRFLDGLLASLFQGRIVEATETQLVLRGCSCSFGGCSFGASPGRRTSLCRVTTGMLGYLVAQSQGYAHVRQRDVAARGDGGCLTIIEFKSPATPSHGEEYFRRGDGPGRFHLDA